MTSNKQTTRNLPGKELQYFLLNLLRLKRTITSIQI